jgi:hypothetical protein
MDEQYMFSCVSHFLPRAAENEKVSHFCRGWQKMESFSFLSPRGKNEKVSHFCRVRQKMEEFFISGTAERGK